MKFSLSLNVPYLRQTTELSVERGVTPCLIKNIFRNLSAQVAFLVYLKRQLHHWAKAKSYTIYCKEKKSAYGTDIRLVLVLL